MAQRTREQLERQIDELVVAVRAANTALKRTTKLIEELRAARRELRQALEQLVADARGRQLEPEDLAWVEERVGALLRLLR